MLCFGSLNIDKVYDVEEFVKEGQTISSLSFNVYPGGKGLNQSIALARSGLDVFHAGIIGSSDAKLIFETLKESNVDARFIKVLDVESGHAMIQRKTDGQNCIIVHGGANHLIDLGQIYDTLAFFESGDVIVLQNEINFIKEIISAAKEKGLIVVLNPSPMKDNILDLPFGLIDYLILNETEAISLLQSNSMELQEVTQSLRNKFPNIKFVLTLGEKGALYSDSISIYFQEALQVNVRDTTAAGDTFSGYFLSAIIEKKSIKQALLEATVASSITVSREGASPSIPYRNEVIEQLRLLN